MAKKRIVSSKKNVPSHALSSKEAALQGRSAGGEDGDVPDSPVSSRDSSVLSSDDEDVDDVSMKTAGDEDATTVAVEVMPSSVGRGKQLRFPAIVSRGKEAPMLPDSDAEVGSDSDESLLSIDSDEEEETAVSQPISEDRQDVLSQSTDPMAAAAVPENEHSETSVRNAGVIEDSPVGGSYPIKASRARKRHRPDSGYYNEMSTYVRDCLLSVRDGAEAADVFREEEHHDEFRRRLEDGTVERVKWKEPPPVDPVESTPPASGSTKSHSSRKSPNQSKKRSNDANASKENSTSRSRDKDSRKKSRHSSDKTKSSPVKPVSSPASNGTISKPSLKTVTTGTQTEPLPEPVPSSPSLCSKCKNPIKSEAPVTPDDLTSRNAESVKKEETAVVAPPLAKVMVDKATSTIAAAPEPAPAAIPIGEFTIQPSSLKDIARLRSEANRLNEEARKLKHEGNHRGSSVPGTNGQVAQATFYLRSGAKFFQNALKLQDVKAAYKELGDNQHARSFDGYSITTLSQTTSLIESTVRTFQSAGNTRLAAVAYKMASVVHLAVFRLQHLKLASLYSETFTPGRSPEIRSNGTTPPITGGPEGGSKDAAVRTHLLKEMEHTLRGFEMWRRYEACKVTVLPRVTNPVVLDLDIFFDDLNAELNSSSA